VTSRPLEQSDYEADAPHSSIFINSGDVAEIFYVQNCPNIIAIFSEKYNLRFFNVVTEACVFELTVNLVSFVRFRAAIGEVSVLSGT